jgi:hypothetical protein
MSFADSNIDAVKNSPKLTGDGRKQWSEWFEAFMHHCHFRDVWELVDPDAPDIPSSKLVQPRLTTLEELMELSDAERAIARQEWSNTPQHLQTGDEPTSAPTKYEDVVTQFNSRLAQHNIVYKEYLNRAADYKHMYDWVHSTVDKDLIRPIRTTGSYSGSKLTLQTIIRDLRDQCAPAESSSLSQARKEYRAVLDRATTGRANPTTWMKEWRSVYRHGKALRIPELEGSIAIYDFLNAVSAKLAPDWATRALSDLITAEELGQPHQTLDEYGRIFTALNHENSLRHGQKGVVPSLFATLGNRSDRPNSSFNERKEHSCPCLREGRLHQWKPEQCQRLEYAITGKARLKNNLTSEDCSEIKVRLGAPKWKWLVDHKNWQSYAPTRKQGTNDKKPKSSYQGKDHSKGAGNDSPKDTVQGDDQPKYPGKIVSTVINPDLISGRSVGVYSTLNLGKHPLSSSTLFDNCGAVHLVNNKDLIEQGSFRRADPGDMVECGSSSLPITGYGVRVLKNCLNGPNGPASEDLVLKNVAVIEGFHVNIVSEALLAEKGVWFVGLDCTLRFGNLESNVVLRTLERRFRLVVLEYIPLSFYLSVPATVPTSAAGVLMFPTMNRAVRKSYRRSYDYLKPRSDTENIWHLRAGHLGPKALEALVYTVRNVYIKGVPRLQCKDCATTHAKQVISKRQPERKSPRPFYRCAWDLFDYELGYNGASWLLVIKEEYSGKLFGTPLTSKSMLLVFGEIRRFETWVRRQYGLSICYLKHDNERAVIAVNGDSQYELWAKEEGIELELSPTYTHEPNGLAERAGQEAITKSIKMRLGARLPEKLWPECTQAAIFLYNMSPLEARGFRTPNEVLDSWFRQYFRWYDPALVTKVTVDLRPDWNGIYVYGARAYPLMKEREAGINKRAFKVQPRGHLGYLVGYSASNIYRIWVPQLDRVIITRNVVFDESKLYSPEIERLEGQPVSIAQDIAAVIEEDKAQDAGSIVEHLSLDLHPLIENTGESTAPILGGEPAREVPKSQNSGVSRENGLLSPENTPEPVQIPGSDHGNAESSTPINIAHPDAQLDETVGTGRPARHSAERPILGGNKSSLGGTDQPGDLPLFLSASEELPLAVRRSTPQVVIHPPRSPPDQAQGHHSSSDHTPDTSSSSSMEDTPTSSREPSPGQVSRLKQSFEDLQNDNAKSTSRRSRRKRNLTPEYGTTDGSSLFTTLAHLGSVEDQFDDFLDTFWPDHPELPEQEDRFKAVYAVIAASVLSNRTVRIGTNPKPLPHVHQNDLPKAPRKWDDLTTHEYGAFFIADAELEIKNLEARDCWRVIPTSEVSSTPIPLKWVFTYKTNSSGYVIRCRSRIVVRGDLQEDHTIISTYAATLAARSFRVAMALAAHFDLEIKQYDVVNAFINARRDTNSVPVACKLPDGFKAPGMSVEIDRALYGMKDSPALWYRDLHSTLSKMKLIPCKEEPCIFMDEHRKAIIVFFVDDVLILYHKDDQTLTDELVSGLNKAYEMREMGNIEWFLGIRVIRDRAARKVWLVHDGYIEKIAKKFGQDQAKCPSTPLPGVELVTRTGSQAHPMYVKLYQEKVGSVLYTAIMIRPDIAFAAAILSRFLTNPSPEHMTAVGWTIAYLWGTRFLAIEYGGLRNECQLLIASDASFADDTETRRSSQGYTMSLFGGLIAWKAARQSTISTSTTQAELLGVESTAKETMALQRFFKELRLGLDDPWTIFCDNQQTIRLIVGENERISTKLRHVDIQNMWLRQEHGIGTFKVEYLQTGEMPADGLTKNLPRYKFEHFRALLNLQDIRGRIEKIE